MTDDDDTETRQRRAEAVSAGMFALDNVSRGLGIEIVEVWPRCTRMRMTVRLGETLVAVAEEKVRQSRMGVYDVTVTAEDGRVVAVFRGNSYRVRGETIPGMGGDAG